MFTKHCLSGIAKFTCVVALSTSPSVLLASSFDQTNLVSSVPGLAANTDTNLVDPWGVAFGATSPFWVADQATGATTLYDGAGNLKEIGGNPFITIPGGGSPAGPTGEVFNSTTSFVLNGSPATFIFANL